MLELYSLYQYHWAILKWGLVSEKQEQDYFNGQCPLKKLFAENVDLWDLAKSEVAGKYCLRILKWKDFYVGQYWGNNEADCKLSKYKTQKVVAKHGNWTLRH